MVELMGCVGSDISCLRGASTETLQKANVGLITSVNPLRNGVGPVIDGNLVPDLPGYLFFQGRFRKDIDILVTGDIDEVLPPPPPLPLPSSSQYALTLQIRDPCSPTQAKRTLTTTSAQPSQPSLLQPSRQSKHSTPRKTTHLCFAASQQSSATGCSTATATPWHPLPLPQNATASLPPCHPGRMLPVH